MNHFRSIPARYHERRSYVKSRKKTARFSESVIDGDDTIVCLLLLL